jgi:predicted permease
MIGALAHGFRQALRTLFRQPSLTIAAIATIALGIGGAGTLYGIVDRLFFRVPAHVRSPEQVVRVYVTEDVPGFGRSTEAVADYGTYTALRDHVRGFASVAAFTSREMVVRRDTEARPVPAAMVTASFFPLLGVRTALGRFFTENEDHAQVHVAVLSHELWRSWFAGDSSILGRIVTVGNSAYSVIGVAPAGFTGVGLERVDLWLPLGAAAPENGLSLECDGCYWLSSIGRLRPGATPGRVASEVTGVLRQSASSDVRRVTKFVTLGPIQEARGPAASPEARVSTWMGAMSLLVLLIGSANVANLLLARALERRREIALRLALGARRWRVLLQLATEGWLLAMLGGAVGLLLTFAAMPVLERYLLPRDVASHGVDARIIGFTAAATALTAVLVSMVPAVRAGGTNLIAALTSGDRGRDFRRSVPRTALLVGQVALALVLVSGAGLFVLSFRNVASLPLGFDPEHLISITADPEQLGYGTDGIDGALEQIRQRVERISGVANASLAIGSPFRVSMAIGIDVPGVDHGRLSGQMGAAYFQAVSPEYFSTLGTAVLRGRAFLPGDIRGAQKVAVVNQTMGQWVWSGEEPIGKCIVLMDGDCRKIVGVVEDVRRNSLLEPPTMQYYVPLTQLPAGFNLPVTALLIRTAGPANALLASVRREVHAVSIGFPQVSVVSARDLFDWQLRPRRLGALVFSLFGGLALLMAAVGIYGVLAYMVAQRTREIAIRAALGAPRRAVLSLVVRDSLLIAAVGILLGTVAALFSGRFIASLLHGISPSNISVLVGSAATLLAISLLASYVPARRATHVAPITALRSD